MKLEEVNEKTVYHEGIPRTEPTNAFADGRYLYDPDGLHWEELAAVREEMAKDLKELSIGNI